MSIIMDAEILIQAFASSLERMRDSVDDLFEVIGYLKEEGYDAFSCAISFLGWNPRRKLNMELKVLDICQKSLADIKAGRKPTISAHCIISSLYNGAEKITELIIEMESLLPEKFVSEFGLEAVERAYDAMHRRLDEEVGEYAYEELIAEGWFDEESDGWYG